ncbi:hypothetical protein [Methanofollis fontis]|uniref:Uncharacterized protein n=1 Tax=Methanofollis fontis TaxID=2052832 RepID=A0A483CS29_9EURY|nr:hypothetical protein [Methanofollis fontis]TAJ43865.1 hypothetical protein CUJ86_07310 [Methanofollis fontis]
MASRVVRIDEEALALALQYGPNLSQGVKAMHAAIEAAKKKEKQQDLEGLLRRVVREELEVLTGPHY